MDTVVEEEQGGSEPVSVLRGAGVAADGRRVARIVAGLILLVVLGVAAVLGVAGASKNAEITKLRERGVVVQATVVDCRGLLGGSGSNLAGYACSGAFRIGDHRYVVPIPDTVIRAPGSTVRLITVGDDPQLVSTPRALAAEHASWRVFIAPAVLLLAAAGLGGWLLRRRRSAGAALPAPPPRR